MHLPPPPPPPTHTHTHTHHLQERYGARVQSWEAAPEEVHKRNRTSHQKLHKEPGTVIHSGFDYPGVHSDQQLQYFLLLLPLLVLQVVKARVYTPRSKGTFTCTVEPPIPDFLNCWTLQISGQTYMVPITFLDVL